MGLSHDAALFARYLGALRAHVRNPVDEASALATLRTGVARREETFLATLRAAVPVDRPTLVGALLGAAGIERGDVVGLVEANGLESALRSLHEAGVRLTFDELRGRVPVVRRGAELATRGPGTAKRTAPGFQGRTGGSRSGGVAVGIDLSRPAAHAVYHAALLRAFDVGRPRTAIWFPAPPSVAGLSSVLSHARLGMRIERWFSQTAWTRAAPRDVAVTAGTLIAGRLYGVRVPRPEQTVAADAGRVARWLASVRATGESPSLVSSPSVAVRTCAAARELGLDVAGTLFRVNGEPLTPARATEIAAVGGRAASGYYVAEAGGALGMACGRPDAVDDVHVTLDRVALVQPDRPGDGEAGSLAVTTFDPHASGMVVNLELGDAGVLDQRSCGCAFDELGLGLHLHTIRSAEKLTSEGMSLGPGDVVELLEVVLPARFGGSAADYQLVERASGAERRIAVVASPRLGALDELRLVDEVKAFLRSADRGRRLMGDVWEASGTLTVERREPYVTAGAKTPSVYVIHED